MSNGVDRVANLSAQEKRALLAQLLQKKLSATQTVCPLSYGQQSMWFMYQLAPDSAAYNVVFSARVVSEVDVALLKRVCQNLVDRQACLRTTFALQADRLVQIIPGYREVAFEQVDVAACTEAELQAEITQAAERPFDLENGPVFRVSLFTRDRADHVLLIAAHHIVLDGWSMGVLLTEFRLLYEAERSGQVAALPVLPAQYKDFVEWQAAMLAGSEGERHWRYWQQQLSGERPALELPFDRPRPPRQTFNGATLNFTLGEVLSRQLKELARIQQATLYTVLLSAFQVLLYRYTGQADIWVGSPTAGRSRAEYAGLIGDFINMNVLRGNLTGNPSFAIFLAQMRQTVFEAIEHQDYPFLLLVERLVTRRAADRTPLFQVAFDLQRLVRSNELATLLVAPDSGAHVDVAGLVLAPYPITQQEGQFDLTLQLAELEGALAGAFKYNRDLFEAATIDRLQARYRAVLEEIVANPEQRINDWPLFEEAQQHVTPADREEIEF
ncbi:MAG: hypothetical protein HY870_24605 [Chloroflexi bacterium]|nr:hypothetical protein [Chloroflexota bacterium]